MVAYLSTMALRGIYVNNLPCCLQTMRRCSARVQIREKGLQLIRNNDAAFEHTCGSRNGLDEWGDSVKIILHGRDLDNEYDEVCTSSPTRHTKDGCQLGDPLVPEGGASGGGWRECHNLEDLAVGPASLRLFLPRHHRISHRMLYRWRKKRTNTSRLC